MDKLYNLDDYDEGIAHVNIFHYLTQNYNPVYDDYILETAINIVDYEPQFFLSIQDRVIDKLTFSLLDKILSELEVHRTYYTYKFIYKVSESLIRTNRIADWDQLKQKCPLEQIDNSPEIRKFVLESLKNAGKYDRSEVLGILNYLLLGREDLISQTWVSIGMLTNPQFNLSQNNDVTLKYILYGAVRLWDLNKHKENKIKKKTKIAISKRNIDEILEEFDKRQSWSQLFSLNTETDENGDQTPLTVTNWFYRIIRDCLYNLESIDYILTKIVKILDNPQRLQFKSRLQFNKMLKYLYSDQIKSMIVNLESAQIVYEYLILDANRVRLNYNQVVPALLNSYYDDVSPPQILPNKKEELMNNFMNWLSSLKGFELGPINSNYFKQVYLSKLIIRYIDNYAYSYENFSTINYTIPAKKEDVDEERHQIVLQDIAKIIMVNVVNRDFNLIIKLLSMITDRNTIKERFLEVLNLDEVHYLILHNLLFNNAASSS